MKTHIMGLILGLYSIGVFAQPTNFRSSNIKAYNFLIEFTADASASGYLVVRSQQPVSFTPVNGTTYEMGQGVGNAKVFSVGVSTSIFIKEVVANTTYYFDVYSYTGSGAGVVYNSIKLSGSVTSSGASYGAYYNYMDPQSSNFISSLTSKLQNHNFVDYGNYSSTVVPNLLERDTTLNRKVVNCSYSGEFKIYSPVSANQFFSTTGYNRDHIIPQDWMRSKLGVTGSITSYPSGADYHNLAVTNGNSVNGKRSDYPMDKVFKIDSTALYLNAKRGKDSTLINTVYEPGDDYKGDVARAMMYQMICYNNIGGSGSWGLSQLGGNGPKQRESILKYWHKIDPPSNFEIALNQYIYTLQGNRNPFIDFPDWADCIDFNNLVQLQCNAIAPPPYLSINSNSSTESVVYPNPVIDKVSISKNIYWEKINVYSVLGEKVLEFKNNEEEVLNLSSLNTGQYILEFLSKNRSFIQKIEKY